MIRCCAIYLSPPFLLIIIMSYVMAWGRAAELTNLVKQDACDIVKDFLKTNNSTHDEFFCRVVAENAQSMEMADIVWEQVQSMFHPEAWMIFSRYIMSLAKQTKSEKYCRLLMDCVDKIGHWRNDDTNVWEIIMDVPDFSPEYFERFVEFQNKNSRGDMRAGFKEALEKRPEVAERLIMVLDAQQNERI